VTAASYSWPIDGLLLNDDFEDGSGTTFTGWTTSGTVNELAAGGVGGTRAPELEGTSGTIYQDLTFTTAAGRWLDCKRDHQLTYYAKRTAGTVTALQVRLLLYNGSSTLTHYYDWQEGRWKAIGDYTASTAPYWGQYVDSALDWTQYWLPRILAPCEATNLVSDSYKIRISFTNASGSGATNKVGIDDVVLSPYLKGRVAHLGRFMVGYNGWNYPVKYDLRTGLLTELSLHAPYATPNSALPTVTTNNTGGLLTADAYYGFIYIFENRNIGERSGTPLGVAQSSAYYTEQAPNTGTGKIAHDFSAIELPNSEAALTTDNTTEITHISVFRTLGYADVEQARADLEAGLVYYESTVAVNATHESTASDQTLLKQGALSDYIADPTAMPMPNFDAARVWRQRLWVSGGPEYRLGAVDVTANSPLVIGINRDGSTPATRWGRGVVGYTFRRIGDTVDYDVEEYYYPGDNLTSTSIESLYLTEGYRGSTNTVEDYLLRPKHGRVFYTEEGKVFASGFSNWVMLDGDQSGKVLAIVPAGNNICFATRDATYAFNYGAEPQDSGGLATAIRRGIGCVAPDSAAEVNGLAYWMSDEGIVRCDGTSVQVISTSIRRIFTDREDPDYIVRRRSDGTAVDAYGIYYPARNQYLLAVRTRSGTTQGADMVIVHNTVTDSWDLYRVSLGISGWSFGQDDGGNPVLLMSDPYGGLWKWDVGYVDGAGENNNHGQLTGKIQSTSTLTDTITEVASLFVGSMSNNFASAALDLENATIKIVAGTGKGQVRRIVRNDGTTIYRDEPWDTAPDTDSIWEIGTIRYVWRFKRAPFGSMANVKRLRHLMVDYDKESLGGGVSARVYKDDADVSVQGDNPKAFSTTGGGRVQVGLDDAAGNLLRVELENIGPESPLRVRGLALTYYETETK
jgi:hypothetical protein